MVGMLVSIFIRCGNNHEHEGEDQSLLYADLKMGQTGNIRVKGFASESDKSSGTVTRWTIYSGSLGGSGGTRYFYVPVDSMGRLMGYGQWAVKRLDEDYTPRISGSHTMNLIRATCPTLPGSSCGAEPTIYIHPGNENYKFLIGHEIGHWFHDVWGSLYGWGYEGTRGNDNDCWFPNEDSLGNHALRSLEYAGGAYTEGTAHFLSTLAFNNATDVAWFRYYKEAVVDISQVPFETVIAYADLAQGDYRVNVENGGDAQWGGTTAWMRNKCPTEASWGGYSVEMDWLRFWWDVRTNYSKLLNGQTISPLSTREIFDFLRFTEEVHPWENRNAKDVWEKLEESIEDSIAGLSHYESTFKSLADWNGVNY